MYPPLIKKLVRILLALSRSLFSLHDQGFRCQAEQGFLKHLHPLARICFPVRSKC